MTSLKKPLIAIASALALVTTLVAAPAQAAVTFTLTGNGTATGADADHAISLTVPSDNNVTTADVLRIELAGLANNVTVTATATDAKLTATVGTDVLPSAGTATATVTTGTGTTAAFNVFTTTTKTGKVVLSDGTNILATYYVKGTAGALNAIALVAPTAALGTTAKVTATGIDVFGNAVSGATVALQVISATATNTYSLTTTTDGTAVKELTGLSVDTYDLIATATVAAQVTGLAKPVGFVKGQLKVVDLAALVATKDAELAVANATIADLKAQLVAVKAAEIKKYNTLATLYNKTAKKKIALRK